MGSTAKGRNAITKSGQKGRKENTPKEKRKKGRKKKSGEKGGFSILIARCIFINLDTIKTSINQSAAIIGHYTTGVADQVSGANFSRFLGILRQGRWRLRCHIDTVLSELSNKVGRRKQKSFHIMAG